jgi:hypothetical protein
MSNQNNSVEEGQIVYKFGVDYQCPNCGHFTYRSENDNNNSGCAPYVGIFFGNALIWAGLNWITSELFQDLMGILAIISFIVLCIFKKKIFPTKKAGEFIEFKCNNCNYKNNLKVL